MLVSRVWEQGFFGRRLGYSSHRRSGCVFLVFVSRLIRVGVLNYIGFGFGGALFYGGRPILLSGRDGFLSIFFADFCFREAVTSSASLSSVSGSGRRWLLQHRSPAWSPWVSPTSIYESELHLILCLSFWICCRFHVCRRWWIDCRRSISFDTFVDLSGYESRYAYVVYELVWMGGWIGSSRIQPHRRRWAVVLNCSFWYRRKKEGSGFVWIERHLVC